MNVLMQPLIAALVFTFAPIVTAGPLPVVPDKAELVRDEPIFCPDERVLYLHVFDTNPETQAAVAVVGQSGADHSHGPARIVVIIADDGTQTFYVADREKPMSREEFNAAYPLGPCDAMEQKRT